MFRDRTSAHEEMAAQFNAFVASVREWTGATAVNVVGHSLGVTGAHNWLHSRDRYDWVETLVGLAGPNHGTKLSSLGLLLGID